MRVRILPDREVDDISAGTVADLLGALSLNADAHLVVRGDDILTRDVRLSDTDELEIYPVISGGLAA